MNATAPPEALQSAPAEPALAPRYRRKYSWLPLLAMVTTLVLAGVVIWRLQVVSEPAPARTNQRFVLPEGFAGPLRVYYGVAGAPPLAVDDGWRVLNIPRSGLLETSSPIEYGNGQDVVVRQTAAGEVEMLEPKHYVKRRMVGISGDTNEWANHALELNAREKLIEAGNWKSQATGEPLVGKPYEILYIRDDF